MDISNDANPAYSDNENQSQQPCSECVHITEKLRTLGFEMKPNTGEVVDGVEHVALCHHAGRERARQMLFGESATRHDDKTWQSLTGNLFPGPNTY